MLVCHWSAYQRTTIDLGDGRECLATPVPARAWPGLSVVCLRAQEAHKKSFNMVQPPSNESGELCSLHAASTLLCPMPIELARFPFRR